MFGNEATSDSVRPLRPHSSKSNARRDAARPDPNPAFFEPDRRLNEGDPHEVVAADHPSLFPELVFDPTATGSYSIDLTKPSEGVIDITIDRSADGDDCDQVDPVTGSATEAEQPSVFFGNASTSPTRPQPPTRRGGPASSRQPIVLPVNEDWLQQSLFPSSRIKPPASPYEPAAVSQQRFARSVVSRGSGERWFLRPIVWLVGGLLVVFVLFLGLLVQDGGGSESNSPAVTNTSSGNGSPAASTVATPSPPSSDAEGLGGRTGSGAGLTSAKDSE